MRDARESPWRYLLSALLAFLFLGADMVSVLIGKLLDGRPLSDPQLWSTHWYATIGAFLCSVVIWAVFALVMLEWMRRRRVLGSLLQLPVDRNAAFVFIGSAAVLAMIAFLEAAWSGTTFPSLLAEYRGFGRQYPDHATVVTAFQYLYYLFESVMVVLVIAFFQRAGELWTRSTRTPWGGIGLLLTWGAAHFGTHPEGAIAIVPVSLLFGIAFTLTRKSVIPAFVLVFLLFVF